MKFHLILSLLSITINSYKPKYSCHITSSGYKTCSWSWYTTNQIANTQTYKDQIKNMKSQMRNDMKGNGLNKINSCSSCSVGVKTNMINANLVKQRKKKMISNCKCSKGINKYKCNKCKSKNVVKSKPTKLDSITENKQGYQVTGNVDVALSSPMESDNVHPCIPNVKVRKPCGRRKELVVAKEIPQNDYENNDYGVADYSENKNGNNDYKTDTLNNLQNDYTEDYFDNGDGNVFDFNQQKTGEYNYKSNGANGIHSSGMRRRGGYGNNMQTNMVNGINSSMYGDNGMSFEDVNNFIVNFLNSVNMSGCNTC